MLPHTMISAPSPQSSTTSHSSTSPKRLIRKLRPLASLGSLSSRKSNRNLPTAITLQAGQQRSSESGRFRRHSSHTCLPRAGPDQDDLRSLRAVVEGQKRSEISSLTPRVSSLRDMPSGIEGVDTRSTQRPFQEHALQGHNQISKSMLDGRTSTAIDCVPDDPVETMLSDDEDSDDGVATPTSHQDQDSINNHGTYRSVEGDSASASAVIDWDAEPSAESMQRSTPMHAVVTQDDDTEADSHRPRLVVQPAPDPRFSVRSLSDWDNRVFPWNTDVTQAREEMSRSRSSTAFSDRRKSAWDSLFQDLARDDGVNHKRMTGFSTRAPEEWDALFEDKRADPRASLFSRRAPADWDACLDQDGLVHHGDSSSDGYQLSQRSDRATKMARDISVS